MVGLPGAVVGDLADFDIFLVVDLPTFPSWTLCSLPLSSRSWAR